MNPCEHHEIQLSSWLDEGLERVEQLLCLDHLARCASCRRFYLEARALEALVTTVRSPAEGPAPPAGMWQRIEHAARRPVVPRVPGWALQAAAVLVLAIGLSVMLWQRERGATPPGDAEIVIGGGAAMTDSRFVELTKEVLAADPRYRVAMQQVLDQVTRDTGLGREASADEAIEPVEGVSGRERVERGARVPA